MVAFRDMKDDQASALFVALLKAAFVNERRGDITDDIVGDLVESENFVVLPDGTVENTLRELGLVPAGWKCITEMDDAELAAYDKQMDELTAGDSESVP